MKIIIVDETKTSSINKRLDINDNLNMSVYSRPLEVTVNGESQRYDGMQIVAGDVYIADELLAPGVNVSEDGLTTFVNHNAEEYDRLLEHIKNLALLNDTSAIIITTYINSKDTGDTIVAVNRASYDNRVYSGTNDSRFSEYFDRQNGLLLEEFHFNNINTILNNYTPNTDTIYTYDLDLTTYLNIDKDKNMIAITKHNISNMYVELLNGGRFGCSLKINGCLLANGIYMLDNTSSVIANIEEYLDGVNPETTSKISVMCGIDTTKVHAPTRDIPSAYKDVRLSITKTDIYNGTTTRSWDFVSLAYFK
jgi:hypothetical protein